MSTNYTNIPGDLGGGAGVSSVNGLSGAVTLSAGTGITLTPTGNDIEISATGGSLTGAGSPNQIAVWDSGSNLTFYSGSGFEVNLINGTVQFPNNIIAQTDAGSIIGGAGPGGAGHAGNRFTELYLANYVMVGLDDGASNTIYVSAVSAADPTIIIKKGAVQANLGFDGTNVNLDQPLILNANLRVTGNIGVGNSAAATTPGTVQNKIEIFNQAGVSLGFIAVYDAIT